MHKEPEAHLPYHRILELDANKQVFAPGSSNADFLARVHEGQEFLKLNLEGKIYAVSLIFHLRR